MRFQLVSKICLVIFGLVGSLIVFNSLFYFNHHHYHHLNADDVVNVQRRSVADAAAAIRIDLNYLQIIKLFERANQALEFFENNFEQLNPDGLFGVRIAQGLAQIFSLFILILNFCYPSI